jgi:hypothetical protein
LPKTIPIKEKQLRVRPQKRRKRQENKYLQLYLNYLQIETPKEPKGQLILHPKQIIRERSKFDQMSY